MSRSGAFVTVTCDVCGEDADFELEAAHFGVWVDESLPARLEGAGWNVQANDDTGESRHLCPACAPLVASPKEGTDGE